MRYWWVNQNKTFAQEIGGGYMWSPKRRRNGDRNIFYDNMREVALGDIIFSFRKSVFAAIGVATSCAYDCIIPEEFSNETERWNSDGWRVDVHYIKLTTEVAPSRHMEVLRPLLPAHGSPLQANGHGVMNYLFAIPEPFAQAIAGLIGREAAEIVHGVHGELLRDAQPFTQTQAPVKEWEDHVQDEIQHDASLRPTEKKALVSARIGQGIFKANVHAIEGCCRITGVRNPNHLIGSHIKPWRHSDNQERLDGENGLLLTPSIDHLFDKGHISFKDTGNLLISPIADRDSLARMGVKDENSVIVRSFTHIQQRHLEFHRDTIFLCRSR